MERERFIARFWIVLSLDSIECVVWTRPSINWLICNLAALRGIHCWYQGSNLAGRDCEGRSIFHSRRYFPRFDSLLLPELTSLLWSVVSLISLRVNMVAISVAANVTTDFQIHSYVAVEGPFWLRSLLEKEAAFV